MRTEHKRQLVVLATIALLFCAGGVVSIVFGVRMYKENRAFAARAKSAEGMVIDFETWHTRR